MNNPVLVKNYNKPPVNKNEILRYMGAKELTDELEAILCEIIDELEEKLIYKVCYQEFPINIHNGNVDFGFAVISSSDLIKNLKSCKKVILFGATVGIEIDRIIAKYSRLQPVKALMVQAYGAERIESLCDAFCSDIKVENFITPRFSPGYGDLPLEFQKKMFDVLDCGRKIGLTLNGSLIMTPSKSVTAIMGISDMPCKDDKTSCERCNKKECEFRRTL